METPINILSEEEQSKARLFAKFNERKMKKEADITLALQEEEIESANPINIFDKIYNLNNSISTDLSSKDIYDIKGCSGLKNDDEKCSLIQPQIAKELHDIFEIDEVKAPQVDEFFKTYLTKYSSNDLFKNLSSIQTESNPHIYDDIFKKIVNDIDLIFFNQNKSEKNIDDEASKLILVSKLFNNNIDCNNDPFIAKFKTHIVNIMNALCCNRIIFRNYLFVLILKMYVNLYPCNSSKYNTSKDFFACANYFSILYQLYKKGQVSIIEANEKLESDNYTKEYNLLDVSFIDSQSQALKDLYNDLKKDSSSVAKPIATGIMTALSAGSPKPSGGALFLIPPIIAGLGKAGVGAATSVAASAIENSFGYFKQKTGIKVNKDNSASIMTFFNTNLDEFKNLEEFKKFEQRISSDIAISIYRCHIATAKYNDEKFDEIKKDVLKYITNVNNHYDNYCKYINFLFKTYDIICQNKLILNDQNIIDTNLVIINNNYKHIEKCFNSLKKTQNQEIQDKIAVYESLDESIKKDKIKKIYNSNIETLSELGIKIDPNRKLITCLSKNKNYALPRNLLTKLIETRSQGGGRKTKKKPIRKTTKKVRRKAIKMVRRKTTKLVRRK